MILSDIQCVSAKQILFCRTGEMLGESHMSIYTKNGDKGTTNLVHTKMFLNLMTEFSLKEL